MEWAGQTINKSFWAGAFYRQQRAKGSTYQAAVRALAFKWIRILYRCWQTRTLYDETTYLNALRRRGPLLLKNLDFGCLTSSGREAVIDVGAGALSMPPCEKSSTSEGWKWPKAAISSLFSGNAVGHAGATLDA